MDYLRNLLLMFFVLLSLVEQIYGRYGSYRSSYSSSGSGGGNWVVGVAVGCSVAGVGIIIAIIYILLCCVKNKNKQGHVVSPGKPGTNGSVQPTAYTNPPGYTTASDYTSEYGGQEMNPPPPPSYYSQQSGTAYPPSQDPAYPPPQDPAYPPTKY